MLLASCRRHHHGGSLPEEHRLLDAGIWEAGRDGRWPLPNTLASSSRIRASKERPLEEAAWDEHGALAEFLILLPGTFVGL